MTMAARLASYLEHTGLDYELLEHPRSDNSMKTAEEAHIHGDQLAKGVVLEDESGYWMAVLPATHRLHLGVLHNMMHRRLGLATERELRNLFQDCETGAIPVTGEAYGMQVIVDDSLDLQKDIYFEAGDHTSLVHMHGPQFRTLMSQATHGAFSRRV